MDPAWPSGAPQVDEPAAIARLRTLVELGRASEAEPLARALVAQAPDSSEALTLLALVLHATGRNTIASETAGRALAADPENVLALRVRAAADIGRAAPRQAEEAARRAVSLAPHDATAHECLALALLHLRPPRHGDAVDAARAALALDPTSSEAHVLLALGLEGSGRRRAARRVLREGLQVAPSDPSLHNNLAAMTLNGGTALGSAARHLTAAARAAPQDAVVHANLEVLVARCAFSLAWPLLLAAGSVRFLLGDEETWASRCAVGAVTLAVVLAFVVRLASQVPRGWRRDRAWLRQLDDDEEIACELAGAALIATLTSAFAPPSPAWIPVVSNTVALWICVLLAGGSLHSWFAARRRR